MVGKTPTLIKNQEVLPKLDIPQTQFWSEFLQIIDDLSEENSELLTTRSKLQNQIDAWHKAHVGKSYEFSEYSAFLKDIGYLEDEPENVDICPENIDAEIATMAGPQLVVPLKNARFALNATNARWGSLYDALYGSDCIDGPVPEPGSYNLKRGRKVVEFSKRFLDQAFPLDKGSHLDVESYVVYFNNLLAIFDDGKTAGLKNSCQFFGHNGSKSEPESIFLVNNGLHIEIQFNKNGSIGAADKAHIDDILMEAALSTIMDCEDSVSAVDVEDKISIYKNWLGLVEGNLKVTFHKNGKLITRRMNNNKTLSHREGEKIQLNGRSLLLIRNVGLHMYSKMVCHTEKGETPEGIIDAVITSLIAALEIKGKTPPKLPLLASYFLGLKIYLA